MLNKHSRLSRNEFTEVFAKGRRYHSPLMTVISLPATTFKASVVVSKKVAKKAHDRNRLRRRVYALLEDSLPATGWYVFVSKPALASLSRLKAKEGVTKEIARVVNNE